MFKLLKLNKFWLNKATTLAIVLVLAFNMPASSAALINNRSEIRENLFLVTGSDSFIGVNIPPQKKTIKTVLTAYSSTPDQTDSTPFITASNTRVRDGIVAANFLAFGTKVQIPSLFGDKVFTVEDRMAKKHNDKMDIWFPERHLAKKFGVQEAEVIVLQ